MLVSLKSPILCSGNSTCTCVFCVMFDQSAAATHGREQRELPAERRTELIETRPPEQNVTQHEQTDDAGQKI